tara:strand:+ start:808 stop:1752 length:945 start_codon:yes stop_codon:yes gene_type:complete
MSEEIEEGVLIESDEKENEIEDSIIIVEDDPEAKDDSDEDDRVTAEADNDDSEREAIRERRRKEKVDRKERRETAIKRDKTELDFLRNRNDDLERRVSTQEHRAHQQEIHGIDQAIAQANKEVGMAERVIAKAVENNNGNDVAKAMKYRDEAMNKAQHLAYNKQQAAQQVNTAPQVDDRTMHLARQFMEDNPWYDSNGRDEDSAIVMAIDQSLSRDGYNPQTEEYWDELTARSSRRLPERFDDSVSEKSTKTTRKARGGPAVGSGKEHAPASTRKEVYISPERKAALVEAGVWDDPVLRTRYVKRYAAYDKSNA